MTTYREEEDPFEEDIVFDQAGLLNNSDKMNTAIRRISSGKCALFAKTLGLCGAFFGLGLCIAIPGPTFLSPVLSLQADVSPISSIYAARSSGYLIGSIMGGFLFDHFNRLFLLFISLLLTSVFITIVPWCQVFWLLEACMVVLGISMGFLDTGGNVLCLDLWGRNSGPFMQALHFSFGLGAFVAPLLAAPFLEPKLMHNLSTNSFVVDTTRHQVNLNGDHPFRIDITARLRRDISNTTQFTSVDVFTEANSSRNFTDLQGFTEKIPVLSEHSFKTSEMPFETTLLADVTPTSTVTFKTTQRAPKPKPSKIDGRKLGDENWDKIPVGKPPMADLLPLSTTVTTSEVTTSQIPPTTIPYVSLVPVTTTSTSILPSSILPTTNSTQDNKMDSKIETSSASGPLIEPKSTTSQAFPSGSIIEDITSSPTTLDSAFSLEESDTTAFPPHVPSYSSGTGTYMEGEMSQTTTSGTPFPLISEKEKSQPESAMTRESNEDSEYFLNDPNQNLEIPEGGSQLATPLSNINEKATFEDYSDPFEAPVSKIDVVSTSTIGPTKHTHHFKPGTFDNDTEDIDSILDIFANRIEKYGLSKVQFTYLIVGLFIFLISVVFLGFLCHNPRDPKSKQEEGQGAGKVPNKTLSNALVVLMAIFLLLFVGLELTFGQLVVVFAIHSDLQLTQATGTVIAAVFWGSFAAMRFASIFFASGLSPIWMLTLNFVLCTAGTIVLSALANSTETALWAGTALVGIGLASIFPTSILWMERYIHVSNKVAAVLVVGVSLGEMICPVIIYHLMVTNPSMLMHASLVINFLCIIIFTILWWLASKLGEKYCVVNNNGYQLANQNEEEEDMIDMSPSSSRLSLRRHSLSAEHRSLLNGSIH